MCWFGAPGRSHSPSIPNPKQNTRNEQYGAPGDKFDPNVHDALFEYEDPDKEPGCVGQVRWW